MENVACDFWVRVLVGGSSVGAVHLSQEEHLGTHGSQLIPMLTLQHVLKQGGDCRLWKQ